MKFIYCNVSGESMELLQFLLSFFVEEYGGGKFKPVFDLLKNNSYDLKKTISELKPETVAPIIQAFSSLKNASVKPAPVSEVGLSPLNGVADAKILESLNAYFSRVAE